MKKMKKGLRKGGKKLQSVKPLSHVLPLAAKKKR
jgi:hypothetical protein